jgi:hypothetical protein
VPNYDQARGLRWAGRGGLSPIRQGSTEAYRCAEPIQPLSPRSHALPAPTLPPFASPPLSPPLRPHPRPQVIFGRGNASIGLHFDKDNACAGGSRVPVATYLAICSGAKLTLLLPPGQTLLPPGGDSRLLLEPTAHFLESVRAAGGHFFVLEDRPGSPGAGSGGPGGSPGSSPGDFSATALVMPVGWYHWVVGLTDWHVVYGGSLYKEALQGLGGGGGGGSSPAAA